MCTELGLDIDLLFRMNSELWDQRVGIWHGDQFVELCIHAIILTARFSHGKDQGRSCLSVQEFVHNRRIGHGLFAAHNCLCCDAGDVVIPCDFQDFDQIGDSSADVVGTQPLNHGVQYFAVG